MVLLKNIIDGGKALHDIVLFYNGVVGDLLVQHFYACARDH